MSRFDDHASLEDLILRYLDGDLNEQETVSLELQLKKSSQARKLFRELADFERKLQEHSELRDKITFLPHQQRHSPTVKSKFFGMKSMSFIASAALVCIGVLNLLKPVQSLKSVQMESTIQQLEPNRIVEVKPIINSGGRNVSKGSVNQHPLPQAAEEILYNQHIRPILSDKCFFCHGPDKEHRKAKLRLDVREDAIKAKAFIPGDANNSELVLRILATDEEEVMPPPESHRELKPEEIDALKKWIDAGAKYETHWAYEAPKRQSNQSIDALVLKGLNKRGLKFSEPASKAVLIRRLSFDLRGLPPKFTEVNEYVNDTSVDATEKVIERYLSSPQYGERMAVPWLDAVRYANTVGYHGDQERDVSPFRNYVIEAFNKNKPFDQFTLEQIAGDLIPGATQEQQIAASYCRLGQASEEGGIQDAEYLAKYRSERIRTTSTAWLGSTLGCAECHDHKFDPFTTKDFYQFGAFFADLLEKGAWTGAGSFQEDINPYLNDLVTNDYKCFSRLVVNKEQEDKLSELKKHIVEKKHAILNPKIENFNTEYQRWNSNLIAAVKQNTPIDFFLIDFIKSKHISNDKQMISIDANQHFDQVYQGNQAYKLIPKKWGEINFTQKEPIFNNFDALFFYLKIPADHPNFEFKIKLIANDHTKLELNWNAQTPENVIAMGNLAIDSNWTQYSIPKEHLEIFKNKNLKAVHVYADIDDVFFDGLGVSTKDKSYLNDFVSKVMIDQIANDNIDELQLKNEFNQQFG